jgi:putative ABC transport system ATP-binding protein
MITLANVSKSYSVAPRVAAALDRVDLTIERGEFVAVMGPSGSGKTTMLNIVGLIDTPSSGRYVFGGEDLSNRSIDQLAEIRRRHVGFIFQSFHLISDLDVYENVELPLRYQCVPRAQWRTRVREVLELVGLDARSKDFPDELSGGEQQRVAIARALSVEPRVVLADEPTGNLDTATGGEIIDLLANLAAEHGSTVIVATHDASLASRAPRRVTMRDGKLAGTVRAVPA